jgi:hypothetical protein
MLDIDQLLIDLNSINKNTREQARQILRQLAPLILRELTNTPDASELEPKRFKQSKRILTVIIHDSVRPKAGKQERVRAIAALEKGIAVPTHPRMLRSHLLYLLGCIGDSACAKRLLVLERDTQMGSDAKMARARILQTKI